MTARLLIELTSSAIIARTSNENSVEKRMYFKNPASAEIFIETTFSTLNEVLTEFVKKYGHNLGAVSECIIAYGAPWHATHIETKKKDFEKLTTVSAKEIEEMSSEHLKIQRENLKKMAEGAKMRCIDDRIVSILINGYCVPKPVDVRALTLSINHLATFVSDDDVLMLEKAVKKHIHPKKFRHLPLLSIMYARATSSTDSYNDSIVLSLSGEMTEICTIQNDIIVGVTSCPIGTHVIYRSIEMETSTPYPRSLSAIKEAISGRLSPEVSKKILLAMNKGVDIWVNAVSEALSQQQSEQQSERLPAVVFIHTPESERVVSRAIVESQSAIKKLFAGTKPIIEFMDLSTGEVLANKTNAIE